MQIIGPTAKQIAAEIGDEYHASKMVIPAVNVRYGTYYLRRLLDMFGARPALAAAAYNAGPHAVESWLRGGDDLPLDLFVAKIPYRETRNYVYRVMGNYARYQYLADGTVPTMDLSLPQGLKASAGAY
jgi:soluble lytic murein transglycosylase